jgi:hypothetical protein
MMMTTFSTTSMTIVTMVSRISTQRTRICSRGVRRDVRRIFRVIATQHPHGIRIIANNVRAISTQ